MYLIDKVFNNVEWYFQQLKESEGKSALSYKDLNLNTIYGVIWAITQLFKLAFSSSG